MARLLFAPAPVVLGLSLLALWLTHLPSSVADMKINKPLARSRDKLGTFILHQSKPGDPYQHLGEDELRSDWSSPPARNIQEYIAALKNSLQLNVMVDVKLVGFGGPDEDTENDRDVFAQATFSYVRIDAWIYVEL